VNQRTWSSDWDKRIYDAVRREGVESVSEFANAHPAATFAELAQRLSPDVAPIQVETLFRDEALRSGRFSEYVRDSLVRNLRRHLPHGWGVGPQAHFQASRAFASWMAMLGDEYDAAAERMWSRLRELTPAEGWQPTGPDDQLVLAAFRDSGFPEQNRG
jgi:hypothetical protein